MADYTVIDLSKYRLDRAREDLTAGINALKSGDFRVGANRAYYAIFHSARAVLILEGLDYKKHSAVISSFRQNFVKTGIFSVEISKISCFTNPPQRSRAGTDSGDIRSIR